MDVGCSWPLRSRALKPTANYYIAGANPLEDNVTIYRTIKRRRASLKDIDTKVTSGGGHGLRGESDGNTFAQAT